MMGARLALLGGGKMAEAMVRGLTTAREMTPGDIVAADPDAGRRDLLHDTYGIAVTADNRAAVASAPTVLLAVKPQVIDAVLDGVRDLFTADHLVLSIAAGVPVARVRAHTGPAPRVIRVMPNACAARLTSATALFCPPEVSPADRTTAVRLFDTVGRTVTLSDERLMDAVTALSGSGPAYFFVILEALVDAGVREGLPRDVARLLAVQTARGAAEMAADASVPLATLKEMITSPGGTTIAGLHRLEAASVRAALMDAVAAAAARSRELGSA